ncbi:MAG: indolepyruvate oxidoreductase subunit beta [Deltaproteobacteria bacterium]|nr:indolepyruvate oxidoreductase subunit beta [Deltaproteobacteria bacterium]
MPFNLIITGVGGQGNVLASQIVGRAAVNRDLRVTIGETFGLSQRGGPVMSHIRLSRESNCAPLIPPNMAHVILGLEPLETLRIMMEYGNEDTIFMVNSRPIYPLNVIAGDVEYPDTEQIRSVLAESGGRVYWLEATQKALELGEPIFLNMIMLGALGVIPDFLLDIEDFRNALKDIFPESKLEVNFKALDVGARLIEEDEN